MFRARHIFDQNLVDTLQIGTETRDDYAEDPVSVWAYDDVNTIQGIVRDIKPKEVLGGSGAALVDVEILLPNGAAVTSLNRLKLTHRHREALTTSLIYAVIGDPKDRRYGLVANATLVPGNSNK